MLEALTNLFENDAISEELKAEVEEAWNARVVENRQQATAELREEFAQKYEHDKQTMVEAIDQMLSEGLASEIAEFAADRKQLAEAKAKYAVAMRDNADLLKNFVVGQLSEEIAELRADKIAMQEQHTKLEEFIVESLASEIAEFYEDKKDLAETKVRLVREAKDHVAKVKKDFVTKSTTLVSETVAKTLSKEIYALKTDIDTARRNDFGRKIFEAFSSEYGSSYLNEKSETAKLLKVLSAKDKQLAEAKTHTAKAIKLAKAQVTENNALVENARRGKIMNDLISPLSKDQKDIMNTLLETVQTDRLTASFDKYLPSVIDSNKSPAKKKAPLTEGKTITGNREQSQNISSKADDHNVIDIKRLAGL